MKDFAICIPTRARIDRQTTVENLSLKLRKYVYLAVDKDEAEQHQKYATKVKEIIVMPRNSSHHKWNGNAFDKKQWAARLFYYKRGIRYVVFCDDDLSFHTRQTLDNKLIRAKKAETPAMFETLYKCMRNDRFAHVAISPREGNNRITEDFVDATRAMRVCGYDLEVIFANGLIFNRTQVMADFDITLQLLELGFPNRVFYNIANSHRKSNDSGGCSLYRTPELMAKTANYLKSLHPQVVAVEQKTTTKPWAGFDNKTRTDVKIYWKKALEIGKAKNSSKGINHFI